MTTQAHVRDPTSTASSPAWLEADARVREPETLLEDVLARVQPLAPAPGLAPP